MGSGPWSKAAELQEQVEALEAERAAIESVLDDSGQVEGWISPEGASLLVRCVKAVVVCRDDASDWNHTLSEHIKVQRRRWKEIKERVRIGTITVNEIENIEMYNLLPGASLPASEDAKGGEENGRNR